LNFLLDGYSKRRYRRNASGVWITSQLGDGMTTGPTGRRGIARAARPLALGLILALAAIVGCWGPGERPLPPDSLLHKVWRNRLLDDNYHNADTETVTGLAMAMQGEAPVRPADQPINILCVSGGGKFAAFTAGVLNGWTATGQRPRFDVATGISSGAPVALMAYLGPKYDPLLGELFLNLRRSDLYVWRPVRGLITGTGLMSSRPLQELLDYYITDDVLMEIRAAHQNGQRLFIATSNMVTHRMIVWDIGAIACSNHPEALTIIRKVFLASCSIPGLVPPVEFDVTVNGVRYKEYHADAGNLAQIFVRTAGPLPPGSTIWILSAGKTHPDPSNRRPHVIEAMVTAVSAGLYSLFRADAMKLYALCGVTRSNYRLMALPRNFRGRSSSMDFDPAESRRMYWIGYQMAIGEAWDTLPPDTNPAEVQPPRTGVDFLVPE
jgi:hypothetical protein